jgi:hypothetical protein
MKQVILYALIIITFHLTVLLIPLIVFLIGLSLPGVSLLNTFYWFYWPYIISSPILILVLCYRIADRQTTRPWIAICTAFIGFSPIWLSYLSFTTTWNPRDLAIVLFSPILLGLIAMTMAKIATKNPS